MKNKKDVHFMRFLHATGAIFIFTGPRKMKEKSHRVGFMGKMIIRLPHDYHHFLAYQTIT